MKHWLRLALCGGALAALLTCGASAATDDYTTDANGGTVDYDSASGVYTASYTGTQNGNQYAILVVKGTYENGVADYSISEDTIMYIDQVAADGTGVTFDFIPRSTPDCVVLLGGEFSDGQSPKVLGTLIGQGVTVSGNVKYQINGAQSRPATVELYNGQNQLIATTQTDSTGNYTLTSVPVDSGYTVIIKKLGYLTCRATNVSITEDGVLNSIDISSFGGDIDGDGNVYSDDFNLLIQDFNKTGNLNNEASDIDGSGAVYAVDFSILLDGFNKIEE